MEGKTFVAFENLEEVFTSVGDAEIIDREDATDGDIIGSNDNINTDIEVNNGTNSNISASSVIKLHENDNKYIDDINDSDVVGDEFINNDSDNTNRFIVDNEYTIPEFRHTIIATHEDINDEEQTVQYPKIRTYAKRDDGTKVIAYEPDITIIDTITYENLIPGIEYNIDGVIMNKQANRELTSNGNVVSATKIFTPTESKGKVDVKFEMDGTDTELCMGVVFETLYVNSAVVAEHKDLNDLEQSLDVVAVADEEIDLDELPLADLLATSDMIIKTIAVLTSVVAFGGCVMYWRRMRR